MPVHCRLEAGKADLGCTEGKSPVVVRAKRFFVSSSSIRVTLPREAERGQEYPRLSRLRPW